MKLNRHNYEEYFILYMDNELGSEDRREVEAFAQANPDLKAELDMLLQTKFVPDTNTVFPGKEALMVRNSSAINLNNYEEWLLSYIDDELTGEEIADVEKFVAQNSSAKRALELFQKTKLQPEPIAFPKKESLYRKEEKAKVVAIRWWKIAAAAVLLIGVSTTAIVLLNKKPGNGKVEIASGKNKIEKSTDNNTIKPATDQSPVNKEAIAGITGKNNEAATAKEPVNTKNAVDKKNSSPVNEKPGRSESVRLEETPVLAVNDNQDRPTNNLATPDHNPNVFDTKESHDLIARNDDPNSTSLTNNKGNQDGNGVTSGSGDTYYNPEETPDKEAGKSDAIFASNDGKKNKLRGFFRKVTRTFEKRTNIKATDGEDNDRLLIAGLAIKLN